MTLRRYYFAVLCAAALFITLMGAFARGDYLNHVSDLIVDSSPSADTQHTIQFTATSAVPPSGFIVIAPEAGSFTIPGSYDYTNVRFSLWDNASSTYVDQPLAAAADATNNGVTVVTGTSGSIAIQLSSSQGLAAGDKVRIVLDPITNPAADGSHRIEIDTEDASGALIDYLSDIVAIVKQVSLTGGVTLAFPVISNALPSGTIAAGNPTIELSFNTDTVSTCHYSLTPGVPYNSMSDAFPQVNSQLFFLVLSGFQDNTTYTYYIRCRSIQGAINTDDYVLSFTLAPTPISNTSVTQGGSGGTVGVGPFPNGSAVLYQASVALSGVTAPGSTVEILKDGTQALAAQADQNGLFTANISGLERGTYTFAAYSVDSAQRKTASYSATMSVAAATVNNLNNIVLPPSIALDTNSIALGGQAKISGSAPPNSAVEVTITPKGSQTSVLTFTGSTTATGLWGVTTPAGSLAGGLYIVKARDTYQLTQSDYSIPLSLGVGQAPASTGGACGDSDLNGDKKVNLVDFSILLTNWGTGGAGDLNCDGNVNLADFSILLFNWTG